MSITKSATLFLLAVTSLLLGCCGQRDRVQRNDGLSGHTNIWAAVLDDMRLRRPSSDAKIGAYFVTVEPDQLTFFQGFFKGCIPRVDVSAERGEEPFKNLAKDVNGDLIDKVTGKSAVQFLLNKLIIHGSSAEAEIVEADGPLCVLSRTFQLRRYAGRWLVQRRSTKAIS